MESCRIKISNAKTIPQKKVSVNFPIHYKVLGEPVNISSEEYELTEIRYEHRHLIKKWRNEQMYHLRQSQPLTDESQDLYFQNTVAGLFEQDKPSQILFSLLRKGDLIGYGGLVHINWIDKNAEISFIMDTQLEQSSFDIHWLNFLSLIEKLAFRELNLKKIFTYAFDLRPHLYPVLHKAGFQEEARLFKHCFVNGEYKDVLIHSKVCVRTLSFRKATSEDVNLYFNWASDSDVREQSFNSEEIKFEDHKKWFINSLENPGTQMLIFYTDDHKLVGQVRFETKTEGKTIIGISIDKEFRGKGFASEMLTLACDFFQKQYSNEVEAFIKVGNRGSSRAFLRAGFLLKETIDYMGINTEHYILKSRR